VKECCYNSQTLCVDLFGNGLEDVRCFEEPILTQPRLLVQKHGWTAVPDGRVVVALFDNSQVFEVI